MHMKDLMPEDLAMFELDEIINKFKHLAENDFDNQKANHSQTLEFQAKRLGFNSYHHMKTSLDGLDEAGLAKHSIPLMGKMCSHLIPDDHSAYYAFWFDDKGEISFFGARLGRDSEGNDVVTPEKVDGIQTVWALRNQLPQNVYVLEDKKTVSAWMKHWFGPALIHQSLALEIFKESFRDQSDVGLNLHTGQIKNLRRQYSTGVDYLTKAKLDLTFVPDFDR